MDIKKYGLRQLELEQKTMLEFFDLPNPSQKEKDLYNLKMMLYKIRPHSHSWRSGVCGTLKRAIKLLEKNESEG